MGFLGDLVKTVSDLMGVIHRWRREQRTVVAVLHDLDQVRREERRLSR